MSDLADGAASLVFSGPMLAAIGVAVLAGVVSFASPCVLPLIPGYVGYLGGMAGNAPAGGSRARRRSAAGSSGAAGGSARQTASARRVALGVTLFILGFTAVFVLFGVVFAAFGARLAPWMDTIMRVAGVLVIVMGIAFMGYLPFLQKELRIHASPRFGLFGAPLLGATFALGWTPCIGPTLAAVLTLSFGGADPMRGGVLALFYCLGLGVPFIAIALLFTRSTRAWRWISRHRAMISRVGGGLLIVVGLLLVTGLWNALTAYLQGWIGSTTTVI